jgi:hypothetical protein
MYASSESGLWAQTISVEEVESVIDGRLNTITDRTYRAGKKVGR